MAFLDRFRRKDDDNDSSYYRDEPATNRFTAVLFGLFALFVTLLIAGGLYFGGRAVYRALNGSPAENNSSQQQGQNSNNQGQPSTNPGSPSGSSSGQSSNSQSQSPGAQPGTGDTPSSVPTTGDTPPSGTGLPRTGDEGL